MDGYWCESPTVSGVVLDMQIGVFNDIKQDLLDAFRSSEVRGSPSSCYGIWDWPIFTPYEERHADLSFALEAVALDELTFDTATAIR